MAALGCRVAWETGAMRDIARALPREGGQRHLECHGVPFPGSWGDCPRLTGDLDAPVPHFRSRQ